MVNRFAIYSPVLGIHQNYPHIFLDKSVTRNNTNVQLWNGIIQKQKMRTKELVRSTYAIESIDDTEIHISGSYVEQFPNGSSIAVYNDDGEYESLTLSTTANYNGTSTVLYATTSVSLTSAQYVFNSEYVGSVDPESVDFLKVKFPDGYPAILYKTLRLSNGTERFVGFTKSHIYYWNTTLTRWELLFSSSGMAEYWDADQYGDYLCATNNIDMPIKWDGNTANDFENLDTQLSATTSNYIAKAKFIAEYQNYLVLGNVELSNGTRYQEHIYYSNVGEGVLSSGFRQDVNGDAGGARVSGEGDISGGFGKWQGYLITFKRKCIRKIWNTGSTIPFEQSEVINDIGCVAPGSVGNDWDGNLYFYGTDKTFREISQGNISDAINETSRNIKPGLLNNIRFIAVDEYKELKWAVPYGSSSTANNKILVYKNGRWDTDIDIPVTAFGSYTRQSNWTWDTLPFSSWDEWGWGSWDSVEASTDFEVDICSDADGYTYALHGGYLDNGEEYDSSFELSTDLSNKKALPLYKRVLKIYVYVMKESTGTLALSVKKDNESLFSNLGSISLTGDEDILRQELAIDVRARHFLFKFSGTSLFRFLGCDFEYVVSGTR